MSQTPNPRHKKNCVLEGFPIGTNFYLIFYFILFFVEKRRKKRTLSIHNTTHILHGLGFASLGLPLYGNFVVQLQHVVFSQIAGMGIATSP